MSLHEQIVEDRCVQLLSGLSAASSLRVSARLRQWAKDRARLPEPPDPRQITIEESDDAATRE